MKKVWMTGVIVCALVVMAGVSFANMAVKGDEPAMMVSPQTIVLGKVETLTVHTNIPADDVIEGSITLDGFAPIGVWSDNCGHIAARFSVEDFDFEPGEFVLTLTGDLDTGRFECLDDVTVK